MTVHQHADHDDHDQDHGHDLGSEASEMQLRVRALESILTEKGYVDPKALDFIIEAYETRIGPHIGARVVAKAWADPDSSTASSPTRPRRSARSAFPGARPT
jgi:nitrile hydratase subunit alpha